MLDTLTVLTYLVTHEAGYSGRLHLHVLFPEKQLPVSCAMKPESPQIQIQWSGVPPEADSLAVIIKDKNPSEKTGKANYYWVAYNLPIEGKGLSLGGSNNMNPNNQLMQYHSPWACRNAASTVEVELFALDKRFDENSKRTGALFEQEIQGHVI